jgi:hypothetical protein
MHVDFIARARRDSRVGRMNHLHKADASLVRGKGRSAGCRSAPSNMKVLAAAFAAPLIVPLIGATLATTEVLRGANLDMTPPLMYVCLGAAVGFAFGYVPCVVLGLPTVTVLRRLGALTACNCLLASAGFGFAGAAAFVVFPRLSSSNNPSSLI